MSRRSPIYLTNPLLTFRSVGFFLVIHHHMVLESSGRYLKRKEVMSSSDCLNASMASLSWILSSVLVIPYLELIVVVSLFAVVFPC